MMARKLVCYGLVLTPSLLLGFIGLGARAYQETYEFDHFNDQQERLAQAYIHLAKATVDLPARVHTPSDARKIRKIGNLWARAVLEGKAKTVPILDIEESTSWVVCEEIISLKARLSWSLWRVAQYEIEKQNYDRAARDLATSFVVCQATKGMNLFTTTQASKRQEMVLSRLAEINPYVSVRVRQEVKSLVARVKVLDADSKERMNRVRTALKVAGIESSAETFGNGESLNYWKRLYANAEKIVSSYERHWDAYCKSADNRVCLAGPMPRALVFKHQNKPLSVPVAPFYAGRVPTYVSPYSGTLAMADH